MSITRPVDRFEANQMVCQMRVARMQMFGEQQSRICRSGDQPLRYFPSLFDDLFIVFAVFGTISRADIVRMILRLTLLRGVHNDWQFGRFACERNDVCSRWPSHKTT